MHPKTGAMIRAARAAGEMLLMRREQGGVRKTERLRRDFVTNADHESDKLIQATLGKEFPGIPFFTEESGGEAATTGPLWVIDPIDGTNNFYYVDDGHYWSVSIAYAKDGETKEAVIYRPDVDMLFYAGSENVPGAVPCVVSEETLLKDSRVWTDWTKGDPEIVFDILRRLNNTTVLPQMRVCCTISMMQVAMGKIDGYVIAESQPFDIAAAGLIVERAGGKVTDTEGKPWTPFSRSIVATNGLIHDQLLDVLPRIIF